MRNAARTWVVLAGLVLAACAGDELTIPPDVAVEHTVSFVGNAYDGATGERLTSYTIDVTVGETAVPGSVDADGRFSLGPIGAWDDYTVTIGADGYRAFLSHNAHVGLPPEFVGSDDIADIATHQTLHYDAYLFPADLQAPAVAFTIELDGSTQSAEGKIRLRPTTASVLADDPSETPAGVPGQLWGNDEDLQNDTITDVFSNGTYTVAADTLVYGVTYQVNIWDVAGYQPYEDFYTAGVEAGKTFTLTEEVHEPVQVVSSTIATCSLSGSPNDTEAAEVEIQFNQEIEFADPIYAQGNEEAIDDAFAMTSLDCNATAPVNALAADVSPNTQERGTQIAINGSTLTLVWNPSVGLVTKDPEDIIITATYGGLANVAIQRVDGPASATTLAAVLGQSSITCQGAVTACP